MSADDIERQALVAQARAQVMLAVAHVLDVSDVGLLIDELEHFDTTGPIIDPTSWIRNRDAIRSGLIVARAIQACQKALRESGDGLVEMVDGSREDRRALAAGEAD